MGNLSAEYNLKGIINDGLIDVMHMWQRCKSILSWLVLNSFLTVLLLLFAYLNTYGQASPAANTEKVAGVDYTKVRKGYRHFLAEAHTLNQQWTEVRASLKSKLNSLDSIYLSRLKRDSIEGGKRQDKLLAEYTKRCRALDAQYKPRFQLLEQKRDQLQRRCQRHITEAIEEYVSTQGFTDVKSLPDSSAQFEDITSQVVAILNKRSTF